MVSVSGILQVFAPIVVVKGVQATAVPWNRFQHTYCLEGSQVALQMRCMSC